MNKQEIIDVLNDVQEAHRTNLRQVKIILDGVNLDKLDEPLLYIETDFSLWFESNKDKICAFSWSNEIPKFIEGIHKNYSDLFYGSMRKYNPKTLSVLVEESDLLKDDSELIASKIDKIQSELYQMSDRAFDELVAKSLDDFETKSFESDNVSDGDKDLDINESDKGMKHIDINKYDGYRNPFDALETLNTIENSDDEELNGAAKESAAENFDQTEIAEDKTEVIELSTVIIDEKNEILDLTRAANLNRNISLKEHNILQLKQEKELIQLELNHLEETQKLTQQSVEQLEQYYTLKKEEAVSEQSDNGGFIDFKIEAKKQAELELAEIQDQQSSLQTTITDLEQQNVEDEIQQDKSEKESSIEKQFEELKNNKNKEVDELIETKETKESNLVKLKEEMALLEKEISEVSDDIDSKKQDLLDFEEKEKLKNEERVLLKAEQEKIKQDRNETIVEQQKELDHLSDEEQTKQIELDTINFQIEELEKSKSEIQEINSDELKNLEQQQEEKQQKLRETEELKAAKQAEIKDMDIRIIGVERSLADLKAEQMDSEEETEENSVTV